MLFVCVSVCVRERDMVGPEERARPSETNDTFFVTGFTLLFFPDLMVCVHCTSMAWIWDASIHPPPLLTHGRAGGFRLRTMACIEAQGTGTTYT